MEKQGYKKESPLDLLFYALIAVAIGLTFSILTLLILL
jgi:hypothetical protein